MFRDKYKRDNEKINVNPETIKKLSERMRYNTSLDKVKSVRQRNSQKNILIAVCFLLLIIPAIVIGSKYVSVKNNKIANNTQNIIEKKNEEESNKLEDEIIDNEGAEGYYIPEMKFRMQDENMQAYMRGFIVYDGRGYNQGGTIVSIENAKELKGEKIGVTKGIYESMECEKIAGEVFNISEVEGLAAPGVNHVYKVKGYDEKFRIMTYIEDEYGIRAEIYECLSGITISSGKDIFAKMNIENNIKSVKWDTFDNWNYATPDKKDVLIDENINNFITAIYESIPYSVEEKEIRNQFFYKENDSYEELEEKPEQKFLYLNLKDDTRIELRLFSNGYIYYSGINEVVFKVKDTDFNNLWNLLITPGV